MLQDAGLSFAGMLFSSLAGFGGFIDMDVIPARMLAVTFLALFFLSLYRVLSDVEPARSNP